MLHSAPGGRELEELQKKMQEQAEKLAAFENKFGKPAQSQKLKL